MSLGVKRALDIGLGTVLLVLLFPVLAGIGIAVKLTSGGPVFYWQERIGRQGRRFRMVKFRTMVVGADRQGSHVHRDDVRITRLGRWLRRFSLDELPQVWHVIAGTMSLVGPRPAPPSVAARFTPEQRIRERFRPGMTGWAQVQGRNSLTWTERAALDAWYVEHWSLRLDLLIAWRTLAVVVLGTGLYGKDGWNRGYS